MPSIFCTFYRYSRGEADSIGRYATSDIFKSRLLARQKMALLQEWGNRITKRVRVTLLEGTVIWEGNAEEQVSKSGKVLPGGASQVYIEGIDGKLGKPYRALHTMQTGLNFRYKQL